MSSLPITIPHPGLRKIAGFRQKISADWSAYPYNQAAHLPFRDPFSEFGQLSILGERFPDQATAFRLIDCNHDGLLHASNFPSETDTLDVLLGGPQPPIRILIFQRRRGCPAKSWQLSSEHLKMIFSRYHVQPCFVHRLKSYRFAAGPELYRSCTTTEDENSDNVESHSMSDNLIMSKKLNALVGRSADEPQYTIHHTYHLLPLLFCVRCCHQEASSTHVQ